MKYFLIFLIVLAVLVGIDMWRTDVDKQSTKDNVVNPNCLTFSITISKKDVGTIQFAAIPAMIDKIGLKRISLDADQMTYEGPIDAVIAFETIAKQRGWNYLKSNKNC